MRRFAPCSHSLLAEERFRDQTRHVIEFEVLCPDSFLALPGEYVRLFLSERCSCRPKPQFPRENYQWEVRTNVCIVPTAVGDRLHLMNEQVCPMTIREYPMPAILPT